MLEIQTDGNGHPYIEWEQTPGAFKRAWIQNRTGDKDWAGSGKYLNVVRCQSKGRPGGNPTDFPVRNDLDDEALLMTFVHFVNALTGDGDFPQQTP